MFLTHLCRINKQQIIFPRIANKPLSNRSTKYHFSAYYDLESSWNVMAHGDAREGEEVKGKLANAVGSQYPSHYLGTWCIQHYYGWCAHLGCASSRLNWRPPADLNGLVRLAERRNLVSARVPSHFNWPLLTVPSHFNWSLLTMPSHLNWPLLTVPSHFNWPLLTVPSRFNRSLLIIVSYQ